MVSKMITYLQHYELEELFLLNLKQNRAREDAHITLENLYV